jgi:hypothetical protein
MANRPMANGVLANNMTGLMANAEHIEREREFHDAMLAFSQAFAEWVSNLAACQKVEALPLKGPVDHLFATYDALGPALSARPH